MRNNSLFKFIVLLCGIYIHVPLGIIGYEILNVLPWDLLFLHNPHQDDIRISQPIIMRFERVTEDRFDEIIQHLRNAFFADEPLNKAVKLCLPGEGHVELERHSLSTLADSLSVMALNADNRVVGVALNGILRRGDNQKAQEALLLNNDARFVKIFNFLYQGNAHTFDQLNVDRIFEIRILSVDSE